MCFKICFDSVYSSTERYCLFVGTIFLHLWLACSVHWLAAGNRPGAQSAASHHGCTFYMCNSDFRRPVWVIMVAAYGLVLKKRRRQVISYYPLYDASTLVRNILYRVTVFKANMFERGWEVDNPLIFPHILSGNFTAISRNVIKMFFVRYFFQIRSCRTDYRGIFRSIDTEWWHL